MVKVMSNQHVELLGSTGFRRLAMIIWNHKSLESSWKCLRIWYAMYISCEGHCMPICRGSMACMSMGGMARATHHTRQSTAWETRENRCGDYFTGFWASPSQATPKKFWIFCIRVWFKAHISPSAVNTHTCVVGMTLSIPISLHYSLAFNTIKLWALSSNFLMAISFLLLLIRWRKKPSWK